MKKIGIIKEGKVPIDRRVPLTPQQAKQLKENFDVEVVVQSSDIRCFSDDDYRNAGLSIVESVEDCDIILGVKEVPMDKLVPNKTHFFFSHTIKKQDYNRDLLRTILDKNIQLIDWETLTNENGNRIIAFGRWAGIVGAYNGLWTYGKRYNLFNLRRAHECFDYEDLKTEYTKIKLPNIKIALTGGGRVTKGAMEVLLGAGISQVTPHEFLTERFEEPVFTQLNSRDYNRRKDGAEFHRNEFYKNPELYEGDFLKYAKVTDVLIACAFWDPAAPVLFHREDIIKDDFDIRIIADITCDIEGSIPSTKKPSTIDDPIYDYNPSDDEVEQALTDEGNITVMAVDNLPCELPRDASESFGNELINNVIPPLLGDDEKGIISRATITKAGALTEKYDYLQDYVDGK
ncbi:Alanine dehydrogenase [Ekhidna lutea]|uniref:Saccharopine dehydrogenase [NAD(+), L-lysine-forming] n=1 Tax=Ekhidna lutea TaxID=447679 RepID=A0A239KNV3_EKHLU|nr:NAD(P)-dependent oxidoreductase [Ekhidna lutea]SNT19851.1 Alanine dehydrogenase [Ekhidna lutea]